MSRPHGFLVAALLGAFLAEPALAAPGGSPGDSASGSGSLDGSISGSPGAPPVGGSSRCPTPESVWQELATLLPPEDLRARLGPPGAGTARVQVEDLGSSFRISLFDKAREYREDTRDCARRARMGALFAALVIDPNAFLGSAAAPPAVPAPPVPAPPAVAAPAPAPVATSVSRPSVLRVDIGAAMSMGLDGETRAASWGAALRAIVGRRSLTVVVGAGGFWPVDTSLHGVRLRQWRLPADVGLRATLASAPIDWYGEAGVVVAVICARALDLAATRSATAVEMGGRIAVGARLARRSVAPFAGLSLEMVPDPPSVVALPAGDLGHTPRWWLGASAGVSWGMR